MIRKVGLLGASGRMGLEIASMISSGFSFGGVNLEFADAVTKGGRLTSIEGVETRTLSEPAREPVHLWIDFSEKSATLELLKKIQTPVVIGTTGFTDSEISRIREYASKYPVVLTANTSPGMNQMLRWTKSSWLKPEMGFEVVIEEDHHKLKKDSPSGSANRLISALKALGFDGVTVHATRAGSIVGNHSVRFISDTEELTITHRALDRSVFARGALIAAAFLAKVKAPQIYSMEDVFGEGESHVS